MGNTLTKKQKKLQRKRERKLRNKLNFRTRNYYLYALKLQHDCYYIGMTSYKDAIERYNQHLQGLGAKWTRLHYPLSLIDVRDIGITTESTAAQAENLMTFEYIRKYGLENVRGGKLCYINLEMCKLHYNEASPVITR